MLIKKMKKIIIFSEISWQFLRQRHHHLANYCLSKEYKVVFVQRVVSRIPPFREIIKRILLPRQKIRNNTNFNGVKICNSYFLPSTNFLFNLINQILFYVLYTRMTQGSITWSFVDNPVFFSKLNRADIKVFDVVHNWWAYPDQTQTHKINASRCVSEADFVFYDTPAIKDKILNIRSSLLLPGVADEWFQNLANKNIHLNNKITQPLSIVFFGNLRRNSDLDLINFFHSNKNYDLKLYGLIDTSITFFNNMPIKQFSGSELVAAVSESSIILLPYENDAFSRTIAPAKYFESLATGLLVVSRANMTHLPGWKDFVFVIESPLDENIKNEIESAILRHQYKVNQQIAFAKNANWNLRFESAFSELMLND